MYIWQNMKTYTWVKLQLQFTKFISDFNYIQAAKFLHITQSEIDKLRNVQI